MIYNDEFMSAWAEIKEGIRASRVELHRSRVNQSLPADSAWINWPGVVMFEGEIYSPEDEQKRNEIVEWLTKTLGPPNASNGRWVAYDTTIFFKYKS